MLDEFDKAILGALQRDASLTNAALSSKVNLSASQCSRRRVALEKSGVIFGYYAELDANKLGLTIEAITRVTMAAHSEHTDEEFAQFLGRLDEVQYAHSLTGEADYILHVRVGSLADLADFIHRRLLPHPHVSQVRSDVVLKTMKPNRGFRFR